MKRFCTIILFIYCISASAQPMEIDSLSDFSLGYGITKNLTESSISSAMLKGFALINSPEVEVTKALYGKIPGLNVFQGQGRSCDNHAWLQLHGHTPLILIDGFPRDINLLNIAEVESINVLTDAVATAMYGVQGANGVVLVKTKTGNRQQLKIDLKYQVGMATQYRRPHFADSYTYGTKLNEALKNDILPIKYSDLELNAFRSSEYPNLYPNISWWDEVYNKQALNHQFDLSFSGGNDKFKHYTAVYYSHEKDLFNQLNLDNRYDATPTDIRLNLRSNINVAVTSTTDLDIGLLARIQETNGVHTIEPIYSSVYRVPSAAFPIKTADGIWGGNKIHSTNNPVALLNACGNDRLTYGTLLANFTLSQELDMITKGLSGALSVSIDYNGTMYDNTWKDHRYSDPQAYMLPDGTAVSTPIIFGKDSESLEHWQWFTNVYVNTVFKAKLSYDRTWKKHRVQGDLIYDQQSRIAHKRNSSISRQAAMLLLGYSFDNKYLINGIVNYSGSGYLPKGDRFTLYPALSVGWVLSNENFIKEINFIDLLKVRASYGLSGWDGNLWHELYLLGYSDGAGYYFGNNTNYASGQVETQLPTENLRAERSERVTAGIDFVAFNNKFKCYLDAYYENRKDILLSSSSVVSGVIGTKTGYQNIGINEYKGIDASIGFNDKVNGFGYEVALTWSWTKGKVIKDDQGYKEYAYQYYRGNAIGQRFGLEALGFFKDQTEINNSPVQKFSQVSPGDIKYKDQNGDNIIDDKDEVKMFGTSNPSVYYGVDLKCSYIGFELSAAFQSAVGMTVNLLNSPLYKPLINNGNISNTFLENETAWSYENRNEATMPRLTTLENKNNYRRSSLWYRDASFLKLRNLKLSYTIPYSFACINKINIYVQGSNLFSIDNIKFSDPEQLGATYPSTRSFWAGLNITF